MHKTFYLFVLIIGSIGLLSNNAGRGRVGGPATTAPGESGQYCGTIGCHFGNVFNTDLQLSLLNNLGEKVTEYIPNEVYTVTLEINHTGFPGAYGFQIVSLEDQNNTGINKWINIPSGIHDVSLLGRQYVEQNSRLPFDSIPLSWQAPEEGTGTITFYGAGNAVNSNGNSGGDSADTSFLRIKEAEISDVSNVFANKLNLLVYPNPTYEFINISSDIPLDLVNIYNSEGKLQLSAQGKKINLQSLSGGIYWIEVFAGSSRDIQRIIKL